MNTYTKYVLLRSKADNHISAVVDKKDYPEAIPVSVQPFDLQEFNNNPYVYTVQDGIYKRDTEEDRHRKELEARNEELSTTVAMLMEQVAQLQGGNGGNE